MDIETKVFNSPGKSPAVWLNEATRLPLAFAQVREDSLLDLQVLERTPPGSRVAMVASGGCTASFLSSMQRIRALHIIDPNPSQLALTRLKLHLLQTHNVSDRMSILGHSEAVPELRLAQIKKALDILQTSSELLGPDELIATMGPDHAGRYERLFAAL